MVRGERDWTRKREVAPVLPIFDVNKPDDWGLASLEKTGLYDGGPGYSDTTDTVTVSELPRYTGQMPLAPYGLVHVDRTRQ